MYTALLIGALMKFHNMAYIVLNHVEYCQDGHCLVVMFLCNEVLHFIDDQLIREFDMALN